ncbi:mucin-5AC [Anopheles nili]|uniref:mucin-5AC n=1 Tax=Anopheles nili TaxID=185578 RepID=UPI00237BC552|nr:mucin-5AC [Anopheles nili]
MQQVDDPPYLTVGTEVSAKYKGAFCEAKVRKVVRNIKCKVAYKQQGLGSGVVSDDQIKGALRVGATVEVKHPERKEYVEATLTKIQDCSQYTVVFDDGDITTLRRSALCLKSGRHFNESETLDQLPLTHPEHFGNPVIGGRRGRRSRHLLPDESSDEEDEPTTHSRSNASDKEENIGKVVCVETSDNKKKNPKENWFPGLVVAPTAQDTVRIRVKDEYLVRSFKDGRYYTVPKKEATEFTRDSVNKSEAAAVSAAIEYMDNDVLPPHWDREALFGMSGSCSDSDQELETDSSDDEPTEEKDHFVAQLYKFMDDRGTPLNKAPSITNRDVDLYRLFRAVQKLHGYNRVTTQNQWKQIALRLGFSPATASITNLVKQAYKKFLFSFEEFNRKLGCTMVPHPKTSRSKGRSLVRASSVQSPKLTEKEKQQTAKEKAVAALAADSSSKANSSSSSVVAVSAAVAVTVAETSNSAVEESGNTSESSAAESAVLRPSATKRKAGGGKVKALVDKFEEKEKEREKEKSSVASSKASGDSSGTASKKEEPTVAKKEKFTPKVVKPVETVEKRGRKRKDADSVDSKKDDRESTAGSASSSGGGGSSTTKQEKQATVSKKEDGGPPGSGSASVNSVNSGSGGGNGTGPGSGGTQSGSSRNISPARGVATGSVPDFPIEVGDKLKVYYDEQKVTYEAKVIEIAKQEGSPIYLVHYTGWNTRYDEWVRKERIAENLTNSKTKKGKSSNNPPAGGGSATSRSSSNAGGLTPGGDKTPKIGKRSRGNSKGDQSGGPGGNSTPRSTTPNVGRNKSPATPSNRRPITRGGSSAVSGASLSAAAGRRTSNNTDISSSLSVPTDPDNTSDTDSDEPMMKKCTTNSTSSTTSSNSSISILSTSTKVSTTAEAGSSSDAAAISDEFSNGATKGGGRDYDLNQIRSELKGFKDLKSPGSPASDTTTTTTTTAVACEGSSGPRSSTTDVPKHLIPKQEPACERNVLSASTDTAESNSTNTSTLVTVKKEIAIPVAVKEEESTVTEEDDEVEKSSESETLSEEDSSQSSNKAFSSSPITTMVDSDTAETPLANTNVLSPKTSDSPAPSVERDDSSSTEPLITVVNKAADMKASLEKCAVSVKKETIDPSMADKMSTSLASLAGKPPIKTYGTAATIIANAEKMAFSSLRDGPSDSEVKPQIVVASHKDSETQQKHLQHLSPALATSPQIGPSSALSTRAKGGILEEKVSSGTNMTSPLGAGNRTTPATATGTKVGTGTSPSGTGGNKDESTVQSVTAATGASNRILKSAASMQPIVPAVSSDDNSSSSKGLQNLASSGPSHTSFGMLRSEKKQSLAQFAGVGSTISGTDKKPTLGREGMSAFSTTTGSLSVHGGTTAPTTATVPVSSASSLKHGGSGPLGEKKHFSSSTLTPAQNKLLSKEALSIKSIFESTANRMDEKISDVYEFEDEYDEQTPSGTISGNGTGSSTSTSVSGPRKLVSDVPPAEVVSSMSLTSVSSGSSTGGGLLGEEKRKKSLQRKTQMTSSDPLDIGIGTGLYSAAKRAKKPSPIKTEPVATETKSPKVGGLVRRDQKEKEDQQKEQKSSVGGEPVTGAESSGLRSSAASESLKEKSSQKVNVSAAATVSSSISAMSTGFVQTPIKHDSTFDVLRKSPSFNLVTPGQPGIKEETLKGSEESETKPTPPPATVTTTPGIFTPVISVTSNVGSSVNDRSISSVLYPYGKGPSTSVLLAKAGDDNAKEEPTLENCKKYFNDMNFEFETPNVKKPPSIADKVLKALSQQQQQQNQQQVIKSEKPDFPKYMPSSMHHTNKPPAITSSASSSSVGAGLESGNTMSSVTAMSLAHTMTKSDLMSSNTSTVSYSTSITGALPAKATGQVANETHLSKSSEHVITASLGIKKEADESFTPVTKSSPIGVDSKTNIPTVLQQSSQGALTPASQNSGAHKLHLLEQIPTSRSNDLTESIRKLDPDPRFIHDDESTDSNDSEHRLIIEDAESQGSGEPVSTGIGAPTAHTPTAALVMNSPGTTAVIVHYDSKQPVPPSVTSAKKELFEEKPRTNVPSITHEMASAASAAAVAAVAGKEKLVLKHERSATIEHPALSSVQVKDEIVKPVMAGSTAVTSVGEKKTSVGAKQSLLETIIQMNTASRGMSSEDYLMLKVHEQQQREGTGAESRKDVPLPVQHSESKVSTSASVITSTGPSESVVTVTPSLSQQGQSLGEDKTQLPAVQHPQSQPQQAPNNESLSLLLCEETIPGSPAPKDHDRLPPSTVGRKVYAEPPLAISTSSSSSSSFLQPQTVQTATDLKPVPMDLEPPVMTITIGGNTTISSSSQNAQTAGGASAGIGGSFNSTIQQAPQQQQQHQQILRGKIGPSGGGGESAVDTPNSSPRDSVSQDETHDQESSPVKKRRQRKPSEEPTLKRRRTTNINQGGYGSANNGSSGSYGRNQRGINTSNATDSEDNSDTIAALQRSSSSSLVFIGSKSGRPCQYNFLVNLDPSLNNNQRIAIIKKKIQELRKTYNAIKAELASIDRRRKKLRRRERENKKQAKLNSVSANN